MKPKKWISALVILAALAGMALAWPLLGFERLGQPWALGALLLLLPLAWLLRASLGRQRRRLHQLIEHALLERMATGINAGRLLSQGLLWLAALVCLSMALARPQGPPASSQIEGAGIDLLMALDLSDSTKAADEYPNRLGAAKAAISALLPELPGDRVGLMVFSGDAFPIAPFTSDYPALEPLLAEIEHGLLPTATTDLAVLLRQARERFSQNREETGQALVIFSDGEDHYGKYAAELKALTDKGVRIFTIGLGNAQGARIPETNAMWGTLGYKVFQGEEVVTRLNEASLKDLARAGKGAYLHLHDLSRLPGLLDQARSQMQTSHNVSSGAIVYQERYQAWLLLALILLGLERLLALRPVTASAQKRHGPFARILRKALRSRPEIGVALVLPILLGGAWHWPWESFWQGKQAEREYQQEKFDKAEQQYQKGLEAAPNQPDLLYNQGNSRYKGGNYGKAAENYQKSIEAPAATPEQKAQAWYNLGNSLFRKGQQERDKAEQDWRKAIDAYQQALKINPRDTQALENLNYVQEQLQQMQNQSGGQNNQKNQQNQRNQNQQGQNNQQQNQQNQNQQNQQNQQNNQQGGKAPHSPLDNRFSNQEIENYLDYLEQREQEERDQFDRFPRARRSPDPLKDPLEELEGMNKDPNLKDW